MPQFSRIGLNPATQDELFRAAHDIKGDAATFGYPLAAAAADSLCRIMEHAPDFTKVPNELIAHHVNAIQAIVREHKRLGVASVAGELSKKLRGVADEYLTAVNKDRPEHLEVILGPEHRAAGRVALAFAHSVIPGAHRRAKRRRSSNG